MADGDSIVPDDEFLLKMIQMKMPFGKYKDYKLIDLPEDYIMWFSRKGFPVGQLGDMLKSIYEIKLNGLDYLLKPLRRP
ncbi:MAG: DUF3820 family protein [Candidatus Omnitrophica bacterium]|nr:DUF3820 family protein [Candidatus Omnitrophota bacterium]